MFILLEKYSIIINPKSISKIQLFSHEEDKENDYILELHFTNERKITKLSGEKCLEIFRTIAKQLMNEFICLEGYNLLLNRENIAHITRSQKNIIIRHIRKSRSTILTMSTDEQVNDVMQIIIEQIKLGKT